MLTAEQLYTLFQNKDNKEPDSNGRPKKSGYDALIKLNESYKKESFLTAGESLFSESLDGLITNATEAYSENVDKTAFINAVDKYVTNFNAFYEKLPEATRTDENGFLKPAMDAIDLAANEELHHSYDKEMEAMAENLTRLADAVRLLRGGKTFGHIAAGADKSEVDADDIQALKDMEEVNLDAMKHQLATMMVMHHLKKNFGVNAALDTERVDKNVELLESGDAFKIMFNRVKAEGLTRSGLRKSLRSNGSPAIADMIKEDPFKEVAPGEALESPVNLFREKLEALKGKVAQSKENPLEPASPEDIANDLAELFALREIGQEDPYTHVSKEEIAEKKESIINSGKGLYKSVFEKAKNSMDVAERVAAGLKGDVSLKEFRSQLEKDAHLQKRVKVSMPQKTEPQAQK